MSCPCLAARTTGCLQGQCATTSAACPHRHSGCGDCTFDVLDAQFVDQRWWEYTRCKRASEDSTKFRIQSTDAQIFKLEVWLNQRGCRSASAGKGEMQQWQTDQTSVTHLRAVPFKEMLESGAFMQFTTVCSIRIPRRGAFFGLPAQIWIAIQMPDQKNIMRYPAVEHSGTSGWSATRGRPSRGSPL